MTINEVTLLELTSDSDTVILPIPEDYEIMTERQIVLESMEYWVRQFELKRQCKGYRLK